MQEPRTHAGTRSSKVIAAALAASGFLAAAGLAVEPEPFAPSAALAVAIGFIVYTVIAVAGLLLVRAPWARWLGLVIAGAAVGVGFRDEPDTLDVVAVAVSLTAITGLVGPWLAVWLRRRPSAAYLGWQPVVLMLGALGLTPIVGIAAADGLAIAHGVLAAAGLFFGWGYARSEPWGLWGLRTVILPAALFTIPTTAAAGAVIIVAWSLGLAVVAWMPRSRAALGSTAPVLPSPRPPGRQEAP